PTPAGIGFGFALLVMLVAGLNYANSLALFFTFLLAGFGLVAMHECHRNLLGTALLGIETAPAFAGQPGYVHLTLGNDAPSARHRIEAAPGDIAATPVAADLGAHDRQRLSLPIPTSRRGLLRIGRLQIATRHPFGLFRAWTWVHTPAEIVVYPRANGTLPMPLDAGPKTGTVWRGVDGADQ